MVFTWPYARPLFEIDILGTWGLSLSFDAVSPLSLQYWNEFSWSVIFQPVVCSVKINCPQEDALCVVSQFLFEEMQWHVWEIGKQ